jgi:hypothetical protein
MLPHIRARNLFLKNFKILGGVRRVRDMKMWSKNTEKFTQNAEREKQKKLIFCLIAVLFLSRHEDR